MTKKIVFKIEDRDSILSLVCWFFKVRVEDVKSKTRKREIVIARQISMYLMKIWGIGSLKSIGIFHGRDHSTVIHALTSVSDSIDTDRHYKAKLEEIKEIILENKKREFLSYVFDIPMNAKEVQENLEAYNEVKNQI
jgi:chromosomal replication initiator protein